MAVAVEWTVERCAECGGAPAGDDRRCHCVQPSDWSGVEVVVRACAAYDPPSRACGPGGWELDGLAVECGGQTADLDDLTRFEAAHIRAALLDAAVDAVDDDGPDPDDERDRRLERGWDR